MHAINHHYLYKTEFFMPQTGRLSRLPVSANVTQSQSKNLTIVSITHPHIQFNSFKIKSKLLSLKCPFMNWPHLLTFLYFSIFQISLFFFFLENVFITFSWLVTHISFFIFLTHCVILALKLWVFLAVKYTSDSPAQPS